MADISKITLPNGSTYSLKDADARLSCGELSNMICRKITIDDRISSLVAQADLSVVKLLDEEYMHIVSNDQELSNCLYVIENSFENAYGLQIKNVAAATDLSDAVTLEQLLSVSSILSDSLSDFYSKSDTSSSSELDTEFAKKLEANDVNINYESADRAIYLSAAGHVTSVDCNDFIKDGMLSSAELCGTTLVLKFNTDAGSQPISVEMSSFVDNYDGKITYLSDSVSSLSNDIGGLTDAINERAMISDIPLSTSQLINDSGFAQLSDIPSDLSSFTNSPLYVTSSDVSSKLEEIDKKVFIDDRLSGIQGYSDLSIIKLSAYEYDQLVADNMTLSNNLYIVEDEFEDAYGQQIKNMAPGTDLSDAVNLEQLLSGLSTSGGDYDAVIQELSNSISSLSTDVHELSTSLSNYYIKSETSSAVEISNALSVKAETSSLAQYLALSGGMLSSDAIVRFGNGCQMSLSTDAYGMYFQVVLSNGQTWKFHQHGDDLDGYGDGDFVIRDRDLLSINDKLVDKVGIETLAITFQDLIDGYPELHMWSEDSEYSVGGTVAYEGGFFLCTQNADSSHPPTDTDYWTAIPYSMYAQYNGFSTLNVTWEMLVGMRDNGQLCPGMKYRITDYVTTVDQEDCRSAGHPFDLIVTAVDHHTLDENARATIHDGDDYFAARPFHVPDYQQYLEYARVPLESWDIKYCLDNDKTRFKFADTENGKGVIYWMKDEFGNEAPYDFKNVQFRRYKITSSPGETSLEGMYGLAVGGIEVDTSDEMWCYTFNGADYADFGFSEPYDFSGWHVRPTQAVLQQFGASVERLQECTGNVIQAKHQDQDDFSLMSFNLPNNVFHCALTDEPVSDLPFLRIGYCGGNKLGLNCYDNTFGYSQLFNVLGDLCDSNTFGSNCYSNTFGSYCDSNTFGSYCNSNTFGDSCDSNTFGSNCYSNTFGSNCDSNTFGSYCYSNTFGSDCDSNTFGSYCNSNTFGSDCNYIKFASTDTSDPSQAKSYYKYITVDSGNQYILLNCTQSTYSGNEYKNIRILPGVNNSTTYKTITDDNVNQSFCTTYQPANSQVIAI